MGRTLHFDIIKDNDRKFIQSDKDIINTIIKQYNKIDWLWTSENIWIMPTQTSAENKVQGFVKVYSNELNAFMIYCALVDISNNLHDVHIELYDEGDFLEFPVCIREGGVRPDFRNLAHDILEPHDDINNINEYIHLQTRKEYSIIPLLWKEELNLPNKILNHDNYTVYSIIKLNKAIKLMSKYNKIGDPITLYLYLNPKCFYAKITKEQFIDCYEQKYKDILNRIFKDQINITDTILNKL